MPLFWDILSLFYLPQPISAGKFTFSAFCTDSGNSLDLPFGRLAESAQWFLMNRHSGIHHFRTSQHYISVPFRQLPATDSTRSKALSAALKKSAASASADRLISSTTAASLTTFNTQWDKEITDRADALGTQTSSTAALDAAGIKLRMATSHFIQVFQLGVARGIFSPSGRASYELSVNEETVPNLAAEADLLLWADRIIMGEPRRVANFSEPEMAMPAATDVSAARAAYETELTRQSAAKDALEGEQSDVNDLRPAADQLIKDIWDEVEFGLRQLDAPTLRRRAREWGVFYALRPGEPEEPASPEPTPPPAA
jgi:hypothetical protein